MSGIALVCALVFSLGLSGIGFGQSESLNCPVGTIVSNSMSFSTSNFTIIHEKGTDEYFANYAPWRVYTGNTVTFTGGANVQRITSIVITTTSTTYASAAVGGNLTILSGTGNVSGSASGTIATITVTGSNVKSIRLKPSAQTRWSNIVINYETVGSTVIFNANGGTGTMANQTASTSTALTANTFTRAGYTFSGWNTAADGSGTSYANSANYPFTASTTLYAQWTPNNYLITFDGNGATGGSTTAQSIQTGGTAALNTNGFVRTGFTFSGWATTAGGVVAYSNGGNYTMGTSDVTLYAVWLAAGTHTVIFNANGGSGTMSNQTSNATANLTNNAFTRPGYTFTGWNTAANGTGIAYSNDASYSFSANITLFAQWSANNNTITFDANGGTGTMSSQSIATDAIATLNSNTFSRTGYTFAGWATSVGGAVVYANGVSYTMGSANVTLYAVWTVNNYTVSFNGNGATGGSMSDQNFAAFATANLTANAFTKTGFTFSGWNTSANGSGTSYANSASYAMGTANVTLYAQWVVFVGPCYSANAPTFSTSGSTNPGDTDAGGSPTNTIRLATGSAGGSISTTANGVTTGNVTLKFRAKGWSASETNVTVTLDGQVVNITTLPTSFQEITLNFTSVSANPVLQFSTVTNKRVHIGNVSIFCPPATPTLSVNSTSLTNLNYTVGFGPSAVQTFTLTGTNLDGSNVDLVLANTNFEISSNNTTFSNAITLPAYSGTPQTVYVRLKSGLAVNAYSDVIMIAGGGVALADEPAVNISGAVSAVVTPVISSSLTQTVQYGNAVSYQITANNTPTSYSASSLPAGLSINGSGLISGTITASVGTVNTTITASNTAGTDTKTLVWTITPKSLTISGLSGANKVYDGTTNASLTGIATLNGIIGSDVVTLSGSPSGNFANKNVGSNKSITITGYSLSGAQAGNYTLTQPTGLTANITQKSVTVTGATAQDKVYNGTTAASITGASLDGIISPDAVTISGGGTFASPNAGTGIGVTASLTLSGADAGNYIITQPTGLSANITKANPVFTTSPIAVNVGGTYSLPGSNISSTSDGVLSYTITSGGNATLAGTAITGAVVGAETLTVNQAASTNYNAGSTTVVVNVTTITYLNGDYRTTGSGNWLSNSASPAIWQRFDGADWYESNSPSYNTSNTVYIQNGHTITSGGSFGSTVRMNIQDGGVFTQNHAGTFASLDIKEGGKVIVNQSLTIATGGKFTVENNGEVIVNFTFGNPVTSIWNGTEIFYPESNFVFADWDAENDKIIPSNTAISTNTFNGYSAVFGNVIFDFANNLGDSDDLIVLEGGTSINLAHGDLIFRSNDNINSPIRVSTVGSVTSGIGGDFLVEDTYLSSQFINFKTSGTLNFTINGNMILDAATTRIYAGSGFTGSEITILKDLQILSGGVLDFNSTVSATPTSKLNLHGDLMVVGSGLLRNSNTSSLGVFNFVGTGDGLTANTTQTIDVASTSSNENSNIQFNVKPNSYVRLINRNFELGNNSSLKVEAEGTLDFGFTGTTPLQVVVSGTQIGTSFISETNSILKVTSPEGINNTPSNKGNVLTHARTYQTLGDFHFIGKVNQKTGNGVPTDIRNLYINHEGASNNDYVTFTNYSKNVHNILTMTKGNIVATRDSMLILGSSLTERGFLHYNNGFVLGVMRRWFVSTNNSDTTGLFPMGQDVSGLKNRFARVYYNIAPTYGGHLTVEFISTILTGTGFPIPAANTGGFNQDVINPGSPGYWRMDNETDKLNDGSHTISLTGEGFPTITNVNDVTIIKRVGGGDWFCPGTHVFVTGTTAMQTLTRTNVVGWSNYGFGGGTPAPLPVELITFNTACEETSVDVNWSTASELNSYQYVLENSRDLNNWFEVTTISAAGNSNAQLDYFYSDQSPFQGISYYRLRQIDFNGAEKVYGPISVSCNEVGEQIEVYPNPAKHEFTVAIQLTENKPATTIQLMDVSGKIIHTLVKDLKAGNSQILFNDLDLPDGAYLIQVISNESHFSPIRLVITH